jgi:hypothetical protein
MGEGGLGAHPSAARTGLSTSSSEAERLPRPNRQASDSVAATKRNLDLNLQKGRESLHAIDIEKYVNRDVNG